MLIKTAFQQKKKDDEREEEEDETGQRLPHILHHHITTWVHDFNFEIGCWRTGRFCGRPLIIWRPLLFHLQIIVSNRLIHTMWEMKEMRWISFEERFKKPQKSRLPRIVKNFWVRRSREGAGTGTDRQPSGMNNFPVHAFVFSPWNCLQKHGTCLCRPSDNSVGSISIADHLSLELSRPIYITPEMKNMHVGNAWVWSDDGFVVDRKATAEQETCRSRKPTNKVILFDSKRQKTT